MSSKQALADTPCIGRVLLVGGTDTDIPLFCATLREWGCCEPVLAYNIKFADEQIRQSLKTKKKFGLVIIDPRVDQGKGDLFVRRLMDIIVNVNVVVVVDCDKLTVELPFKPDSILIRNRDVKKRNVGRIETMLVETVKDLIKPKRINRSSLVVQIGQWDATSHLSGINSLKLLTKEVGSADNGSSATETFVSITKDGYLIRTAVYLGQNNTVTVSVQSTIGCNQRCGFCQVWQRYRCIATYGFTKPVYYVRHLTSEEIISQLYLAIIHSTKVKKMFRGNNKVRLATDSTGEGDVLVNNFDAYFEAVKQWSDIPDLPIATIVTSVGSEKSLQKYLDLCDTLPKIQLCWSLIFADPENRGKFMPGTRNQSIQKLRDLYKMIADKTGVPVGVCVSLFRANMSAHDVQKIANLVGGGPFVVKVMAGCPVSFSSEPDTSPKEVKRFMEALEKAGVKTQHRELIRFKDALSRP